MKITHYKGWTITEFNEPSQEALDVAHEVLQHAFNLRIEELRRQGKLGGNQCIDQKLTSAR